MKKVLVIALMLGAGFAYASSIGVPWFVDNAATGVAPPAAAKAMSIVYIHSNATEALEVTISYYTQLGYFVGPTTGNTFIINPQSSLAFRPVQHDTIYESSAALLIANRPRFTYPPSTTLNDNKRNGSCVFTWNGDSSLLSGAYWLCQTGSMPTSSTDPTVIYTNMGYSHLLPAGA